MIFHIRKQEPSQVFGVGPGPMIVRGRTEIQVRVSEVHALSIECPFNLQKGDNTGLKCKHTQNCKTESDYKSCKKYQIKEIQRNSMDS